MSAGVSVGLEACAKTFADDTRALEPVTLEIARGETLVFLGPSGCGKTTTLRIIAGLEAPDPRGRVRFDGEEVTSIPIERRNVGMVFQSYALFPNMNVAENIGYGLKIRGASRAERQARVEELVALTGIEGLERRQVDQLSGGQRQRVALARAVAPRPQIVVFSIFAGIAVTAIGDRGKQLIAIADEVAHMMLIQRAQRRVRPRLNRGYACRFCLARLRCCRAEHPETLTSPASSWTRRPRHEDMRDRARTADHVANLRA